MPLYKAKCSQCLEVFRARTRTKLLSKIRKHMWRKHRTWMIRRIKAGKQSSKSNPSIQDFVASLSEGPRAALEVYDKMTERQYQYMKKVMDAIEPILPAEARTIWKAVEGIHDVIRG